MQMMPKAPMFGSLVYKLESEHVWGLLDQRLRNSCSGTLGEHACQQDTPRTALGNLQQLFDDGFAGLVNFLTGETC